MTKRSGRWSHNIHYHPLILSAVPAGCERALEVGCGEGILAALHHMDMRQGLTQMRELLSPGGTLAVVGLARSRYPADLPADAAGAVLHRVRNVARGYWEHSAPTV